MAVALFVAFVAGSLEDCAAYYAPQPNLDRAIVTFRDGRVITIYYDPE